ncbi:MiaB/RimO family radical SAM methylthiotransferase [Senegalimassilia anaerobia]|uniref:MiaB/RimO family radical SAM methylthiotransferase n=1 Tax=Senegalimassilia anaerobia TaxID=1473216 RepID=UPI0025F402A5|nr:MiaB/RimO family radical SAM methylthiotransferase [Senegalimassilia anaerobia]
MNFAIVNLGCKVNRVESDSFASGLLARGGVETGPDSADVVVVNTCTVTGEAEKKTRKAVRQALRANLSSDVVVTGCAAAIDADAFTSMDPARVHIAGKAQVDDVLDHLVGPIGHGVVPLAVGEGFRTRVGVKVQDGCNNACTYCIVHVARGRASSRPAQAVVSECVALAREGVREIVLTGINLGSWREQAENGYDRLDTLLERLLAETADIHEVGQPPCRFRISSIEPRDVSDDLIGLMTRSKGRICRHLHLPLQSGNSKVLREMHRPYNAEYFEGLVEKLYAAMPMLSLSTDIICGFPGETDQEFSDTVELAKRCRFTKIHVFPYSKRQGTPAAERADQVEPEVRSARAKHLREVADALRVQQLSDRAGSTELALVEEAGQAMTESYFEVPAPKGARIGQLVSVAL